MNRKNLPVLFVLILLGVLLNRFNLRLFFGVDFVFGSIAALIIARVFGLGWGGLAALLINLNTLSLWRHPYAILIFTCEALVVGHLTHHRKHRQILVADMMFWAILGIPLVWVCYYVLLHIGQTAALLIVLKQSFNGLANALAADLLLQNVGVLRRLLSKRTPVQHMLFSTLAGFVLFPMLFITVMHGTARYNEIGAQIEELIDSSAARLSSEIVLWQQSQAAPITALAEHLTRTGLSNLEAIRDHLAVVQKSSPNYHILYIGDPKADVMAFSFKPSPDVGWEDIAGTNYSDRSYFQQLQSTLQPVVSGVFMSRGGTSIPIVALAAPVVQNQTLSGYVLAALNLDKLKEVLVASAGEKTRITLTDQNGQVIASTIPDVSPLDVFSPPPVSEQSKLWGDLRLRQPPGSPLPGMLLWQNTFATANVQLSEDLRWTVHLEVPIAPYQSSLYRHHIAILGFALIVALISLLVAQLLSHSLTAPLVRLARATAEVPEQLVGDDNAMSWPETPVEEVASLVDNYQYMVGRLRAMFRRSADDQRQLETLAYRDALTGLPNLVALKHTLADMIINAGAFSLLIVDLDRFKMINDTYGHNTGDSLIRHVAWRLDKLAQDDRYIARQGGDEFLMLVETTDLEQIRTLAGSLIAELAQPYYIDEHVFHMTASVGVSICPRDGIDADTLIKRADMAMYQAKAAGKNCYRVFEPEMDEAISRKMQVESELRLALSEGQLLVYYQPKASCIDGSIVGAEALVRWQHPELGIVSPGEFISLAEETGLIIPLGDWVLGQACWQGKAWLDAGFGPLHMAVNISAVQFSQKDFVPTLRAVLETSGFPAEHLYLEITESVVMNNDSHISAVLQQVKELGVKLSLDDFGTGYSSLGYLKRLPIDEIKIDRSFIADMLDDTYDALIVEALIQAGHGLGMDIVAEGVETDQQLKFLQSKGCGTFQGYWMSRPLPAEQFEAFLQASLIEQTRRQIASGEPASEDQS